VFAPREHLFLKTLPLPLYIYSHPPPLMEFERGQNPLFLKILSRFFKKDRYKTGCLRGANTPLQKSISPFPLLRGRGTQGDGVIKH
jgi:hypothetical protein